MFSLTLKSAISTHTSLAGRDDSWEHICYNYVISTHTSLAGRDSIVVREFPSKTQFLLTRPSRDVTNGKIQRQSPTDISTHTSLAGRDANYIAEIAGTNNFYSHVPRGT